MSEAQERATLPSVQPQSAPPLQPVAITAYQTHPLHPSQNPPHEVDGHTHDADPRMLKMNPITPANDSVSALTFTPRQAHPARDPPPDITPNLLHRPRAVPRQPIRNTRHLHTGRNMATTATPSTNSTARNGPDEANAATTTVLPRVSARK